MSIVEYLFDIHILVYQPRGPFRLISVVLARLHHFSDVWPGLPTFLRLVRLLRRENHLKELVFEISALPSVT